MDAKDLAKRPKVMTPEGPAAVMLVMRDIGYISVQLKGHDYYRLFRLDKIRDIEEEEYRRAR